MKFVLSLVAVVSISLVSMQVTFASVLEKTVVSKSTVSTSKALSHVDINPFVDNQRSEKSKMDEKSTQKKRFVR